MTIPSISKGSAPNDGTGTTARAAADIVNELVDRANLTADSFSSVLEEVAGADLFAYWKLDEAALPAVDSGTGNNDMVDSGHGQTFSLGALSPIADGNTAIKIEGDGFAEALNAPYDADFFGFTFTVGMIAEIYAPSGFAELDIGKEYNVLYLGVGTNGFSMPFLNEVGGNFVNLTGDDNTSRRAGRYIVMATSEGEDTGNGTADINHHRIVTDLATGAGTRKGVPGSPPADDLGATLWGLNAKICHVFYVKRALTDAERDRLISAANVDNSGAAKPAPADRFSGNVDTTTPKVLTFVDGVLTGVSDP